jgi:HEAT repeat protein
LAEVGVTKTNPKFTRIAAIYAAGFVGGDHLATIFQDILRDETDDVDVRGHAAEALGNIRDQTAITLLQNVLEHEPPTELRVSCEYALHELGV